MILAFALALALQPSPDTMPPRPMVDFLGRRRLCLNLVEPAARDAAEQAEARRLSCATLTAEEADWRRRTRGDANASAWLNADPRDFRLPGIEVTSADVSPAYVRRMEWRGTELNGTAPFQLTIDSDAETGGATLFTAAVGTVPAQTLRIDNRRFSGLDLQSVRAALQEDQLHVEIRYGSRRGYCSQGEQDDRPSLSILFMRDGISASYQDRANCGNGYAPLTP